MNIQKENAQFNKSFRDEWLSSFEASRPCLNEKEWFLCRYSYCWLLELHVHGHELHGVVLEPDRALQRERRLLLDKCLLLDELVPVSTTGIENV